MSVGVICVCRDTGAVVCTRRSGIRLRLKVACLICDQVEAAFLTSVLLLYRHVFFKFCFIHVTEKLINSCVCVCVVKCQDE